MANRCKTVVGILMGLILFLVGVFGRDIFPYLQSWIASLKTELFVAICASLCYIGYVELKSRLRL
jgi:hypothetical protein